MALVDEGSTSPTLLSQVADWQDDPAWDQFQRRYDPYLRRSCRHYGLDNDSVDEVCQRIWIELAYRMRTFHYDPSGTFRGWLKQLCASRVVDFLRQQKVASQHCVAVRGDDAEPGRHRKAADLMDVDGDESGDDSRQLRLFDRAAQVQAAVRARVNARSWEAFWLVSVCDWKVDEIATTLGMTHTAVYAARERVARMLRDEGKRVSDC